LHRFPVLFAVNSYCESGL